MAGFTSSTYGQRSIVVDTISELQTVRGFANQKAFLLSNTSSSDRGSGEYVWNNSSTATADGVLTIQTTGVTTGRWLRTVPDQIYRAVWWAIVGDGSNQATRINAALAAIPAGSTLLFEKGVTYNVTAQIVTTKAVTIDGNGATIEYTGGGTVKVISIGADDTTVQNLTMTGDSLVYSATTRYLISTSTTGLSNSVSRKNINVLNCDLSNYGGGGVWFKWVENIRVENCKLHGFSYAGGIFISCKKVWYLNNDMYDITITSPGVNAYGVEFHHDSVGDNRSEDVIVSHNRVDGVNWEGIDTHGGKSISVLNNRISDCRTGVAIVSGNGVSPENIVVSGNVVTYDFVTLGATAGSAIRVDGLTSSIFASGIVSDNVCVGQPIKLEFTKGFIVNANRVEQSSGIAGIVLNGDCRYAQVTNNIIVDPWDDLSTNTCAIQAVAGNNTSCYIAGNRLIDSGFVVPSGSKNRYGFKVNVSDATDSYIVGYNDFGAATVSEYDEDTYMRFVDDAGEQFTRYTASFTVAPRDVNIIYDGAATGTATLPAKNALNDKRVIYISNPSAFALTLSPVVNKINASTTSTLAAGASCKLVYDLASAKIWMFQF